MIPTPGCEHRRDGGVKRGETGISASKSKYFHENILSLLEKKQEGHDEAPPINN